MKRILISLALTLPVSLTFIPTASAAAPRGGQPAVAGTSTPVQAVASLLKGYVYRQAARQRLARLAGPRFPTCRPVPPEGGITPCPVTPRLRYRLNHPDRPAPGCLGSCTPDAICRCQNTAINIIMRSLDNNGLVAHIHTRWGYYQSALRLTFTVLHGYGGWLVDDVYCTGRPDTTVYKRIVPCR